MKNVYQTPAELLLDYVFLGFGGLHLKTGALSIRPICKNQA
jgi:hypothetical protein